MTAFRDFRGQVSWGRICAAVSLVVAVWREFTGAKFEHVLLWLSVASGNYGASKLTEIVAIIKGKVTGRNVGVEAPPAPGTAVVPLPNGAGGDQ